MAAIIAVWSKGIAMQDIIEAVENLEPVEGRLEVLDPELPIDLIIDYAHTADGMDKLIDAVKPFAKQRLIFSSTTVSPGSAISIACRIPSALSSNSI